MKMTIGEILTELEELTEETSDDCYGCVIIREKVQDVIDKVNKSYKTKWNVNNINIPVEPAFIVEIIRK